MSVTFSPLRFKTTTNNLEDPTLVANNKFTKTDQTC